MEVQDKALFLGRLRYPKYSTTSWQALLVSLIIILAMIGQYSLFRSGMTSVNNVIFADGSVSDNNQLLEMIYN